MPSDVKHPNLKRYNPQTGATEPVMVNSHSIEPRWSWDPDWTPEQQAELKKKQKEKKKCQVQSKK